MALVSIQLVDTPNGLTISAGMEPAIGADDPPEDLTAAQRLGARLFDLLLDVQAEADAAPKIAVPDKRIHLPGGAGPRAL